VIPLAVVNLKEGPIARVRCVNYMFDQVRRYLFYCAGFLLLGLGLAGYFLPGLPGTIFLILAAACFLRSNQRMYRWVTEHKIFGKPVKRFLETGSMPVRAKVISVGCVWIFSAISIIAPYHWLWFKGPVVILALSGTWYILSRPVDRKKIVSSKASFEENNDDQS